MKKFSKTELLAILAAAGVCSSTAAIASNVDTNDDTNALGKLEHQGRSYLGDESSCGKGSCGKDEKGAEAAKEKHKAKKETKKAGKKKEKKDSEEKKEAEKAPEGT